MGKRATTYDISLSDSELDRIKKINTNFRNISQDTTTAITAGESGGGVTTHHELPDVRQPKCHPSSAITFTEDPDKTVEQIINELLNKIFTKQQMFDIVRPVGSYYEGSTSTLPSSISQYGTWNYLGKYKRTYTDSTTEDVYVWKRTE